MPPAVIAGVGLAAAGVGSAISSSKQAKATRQASQFAADTSLQVAQENNALARDIYNENRSVLAPWQQYGSDQIPQLNALIDMLPGGSGVGAGFDAYKGATGYQARLDEGLGAVRGSYSGAGALQSGVTLKALTRYGQDYASNEFGNYVQSLLPRLNALEGARNLGFGAASAQTGVAQNYAGLVTANNNNMASGVTNAAYYKANNATSPVGNALSLVGGGLFGFGG